MTARTTDLASATEFAKAILWSESQNGRHKTKVELQKLLYLVDAASVVLWNRPAFAEEVVALPNGPVVSDVTNEYKGRHVDSERRLDDGLPDEPPLLSPQDLATVQWVLSRFGSWTASDLVDYVKRPDNPWQRVYDSLGPGPNSVIPISATAAWFRTVGLDPTSPEATRSRSAEVGAKIADAHAEALARLGS